MIGRNMQWNVVNGTEADALAPFKHATIASAAAITTALLVPIWGTGIAGVAIGAVGGAVIAWAVGSAWDSLPQAIQEAKLLGKSLNEFMEALGNYVGEKIAEAWEATGQLAGDILDEAQDFLGSLYDAAGELAHENAITAGHLMLNVADWFGTAITTGSPLVLDLEGNGLNLVAPNSHEAVYWDIDSNGFREASGWIAAGMGLLAIDLDQNGAIDNNSELFGNQPQNGVANGFQALAAYDSNNDGVIDANDDQFGDLLVWTDDNGDGQSSANELHTLASLDITSINLNYAAVNYTINGNNVRQESTFTMDGQTRTIADVWFAYDPTNTTYDQDYELSLDVMGLPMQRGYGTLASLHIAMGENEDLLDMVAALATKSTAELFASNFDLRAALTDIMYEWAGVTEMNPTSRGTALDARMISFLEKLNGDLFGNDPNSVVAGIAAAPMREAWNAAFSMVATHFLAQSGMQDLLGNPSYDLRTDNLSGGYFGEDLALRFTTPFASGYWLLNDSGFNDVYVLRAGDTPHSNGLNIYETVNTTTDAIFLGGIDPANVRLWTDNYGGLVIRYTNDDSFTISAAFDSTGATRVGEYIEYIMFDDGTTWDIREGLTLWNMDGRSANLAGSVYADTIKGGSGSEHLSGYAGDDTLTGGGGNDYLFGGMGDDTYTFRVGDGQDTIYEYASEGADTIRLEDVSAGDVLIWAEVLYSNQSRLFIQYGAGDIITVSGGTYDSNSGAVLGPVEQVVFDDNTVWDLTGGLVMRLPDVTTNAVGTAYDDTIIGGTKTDHIRGGDGDDTLTGNGGSDYLYGGMGDDTYTFKAGDGQDTIYENASEGVDTIRLEDVLAGDVLIWAEVLYSNQSRLFIQYGTGDIITVSGGTYDSNTGAIIGPVEQVVFDDNTVWDLTGGMMMRLPNGATNAVGTAYDDTIFGGTKNDHISGGDGNDTLYGGAGSDHLFGGDGDDFLSGGIGSDGLNGGAGADIFHFDATALDGSTDTISDFSMTDGDVIDIRDVLDGAYDPLTDNLADFVKFQPTAYYGLAMRVDLDGAGTAHGWQTIANLTGYSSLPDVDTLAANGHLLAA